MLPCSRGEFAGALDHSATQTLIRREMVFSEFEVQSVGGRSKLVPNLLRRRRFPYEHLPGVFDTFTDTYRCLLLVSLFGFQPKIGKISVERKGVYHIVALPKLF